MYTYHNPVIPGFNPDPSICRNGNNFYLATSSFEFFPGVPIYHSKNLVNWDCIGHCLTRDEQLPLQGCRASEGIYAPTLRTHDGMFFMTTTNVSGKGNFIVNAKNITGPWSNPVWVDQGGIDPSLFFFNNKTYFCSNGTDQNDKPGIFLCEVDPFTGKKKTPSKLIAYGSGGRFPEAPHIYFINGIFYLLLAEGGTEYGHMVTVQRSNDIYGPYELCPRNPILSHRDRGGHPIQAIGHADMVEDQNGAWWMVCHGIRPLSWAMLHNLGRETFLSPVQWVDGWPVVGNNGGIELEMEAALPSAPEPANWNVRADFSKPLDTRWNYIRNPDMTRYRTGNGVLSIIGSEQTLSSSNCNPVFIGMRQQAFTVEVTAVLKAPDTGRAGMSAFYNNDYHYDLYVERTMDGSLDVVFNRHIHDLEAETFRQRLTGSGEIQFRINADRKYYMFSYRYTNDSSGWIEAGKGLCAGLCTETTHTMTFTGVYLGVFASFGTAEFLEWNLRNGQ